MENNSFNKKIINPLFDIRIDEKIKAKTLVFCILNFSPNDQNLFLNILKNLTKDDLYINENYVAITNLNNIYFFSLDEYKDNKFENALISGYFNLSFAFVDLNDMIVQREYLVFKVDDNIFKKL